MRVARLHRPALRPGTVAIWAAVMISFLAGMVAFAVDIGYIALVRNHLQVAADAGAMAGAGVIGQDSALSNWKKTKDTVREVCALNHAGGRGDPVVFNDVEVDQRIIPGTWHESTGVFEPGGTSPNAVKVITRKRLNLFFGAVLGTRTVDVEASAIAMKIQRDIAFVIDMSGSMNNDTEIWATEPINGAFPGYPTIGTDQMTAVLADFGFSTNPDGTDAANPANLKLPGQGIPAPDALPSSAWTLSSGKTPVYNYLLNNSNSPLKTTTNLLYKILSGDSNATKKQKAYRWLIDKQLAAQMPNAKPAPNSSNLAFWSAYLDYVLSETTSSGHAQIPSQNSNQITGSANPYTDAWPDLDAAAVTPFQNKIGYLTYVQFMMDYGRNVPVVDNAPIDSYGSEDWYAPLSRHSPDCPWKEDPDAQSPGLEFPPREQPTHAVRLAVMAAIDHIKRLNGSLADPVKDHVSVITFDTGDGTVVKHALSTTGCNYDTAKAAVRDLQAVSDFEYSTASEHGLYAARNELNPTANPDGARPNATKILVFLSDGLPNVKRPESTSSVINSFISSHPSSEWYSGSTFPNVERNAALMQINQMQALGYRVHAVGVGLGADRPLMDRMARMSGTAIQDPLNPTGPKISAFAEGNPADYQSRLTSIFGDIINQSSIKLVE